MARRLAFLLVAGVCAEQAVGLQKAPGKTDHSCLLASEDHGLYDLRPLKLPE
jgi:hypothetical protein